MSLSGSVQAAAPGLRGFDANSVISQTVAEKFYQQAYRFCVRYLSHSDTQASHDLSMAEAKDILAGGLALMAVQHVRMPGWSPTSVLGRADGIYAAYHATEVGLPAGVNIWCDLEGVKEGTSAQNVIDYCKAWHDAVANAHYVPGLYVGANSILSGSQLYHNLPFQHYWRSLSRVPEVESRGYQLVQSLHSEPVNGIGIDDDVTQDDNKGGQVLWLAPATQA